MHIEKVEDAIGSIMAADMRYTLVSGSSRVDGVIPAGTVLGIADVMHLKASGTNYILVVEEESDDPEETDPSEAVAAEEKTDAQGVDEASAGSDVSADVCQVAASDCISNDNIVAEAHDGVEGCSDVQEGPSAVVSSEGLEPVASVSEEQPKRKRRTRRTAGTRKRKVDAIVQSPDPNSPVSLEAIGGRSSEAQGQMALKAARFDGGAPAALGAAAEPVEAGDISRIQVGSRLYKIDAGKIGGLTLEQIVAMMGKFVQIKEGIWEWQEGVEPKPTSVFYLDAAGDLVTTDDKLNDDGTVTVDGTLNDDGTYTVTV